jgi:hypothetical protein
MGQAKIRAKEIERLKAEANSNMKKIEHLLKDKDYITVDIELTGASKGLLQWAAPCVPYQLDPANSSVLKNCSMAMKDTHNMLPHLTIAESKLLSYTTQILQAIANGITHYKEQSKVFMLISEVLRRSYDGSYDNVKKVEIKMTTFPSPMSMMGLKGDKFIPAFTDNDYIRLLDADGNVIIDLSAQYVCGKEDYNKISAKALELMIQRSTI